MGHSKAITRYLQFRISSMMKSSILMFLACVVLTAAASSDREMDDKWNNYKEKNHMHFSAEEESGRKNLFSETDNFINEQSKNKSRAFAAITPLEFSKCKKIGGKKVLLSEQQLVDCDDSNGGCNGGWYHHSWEYLKKGSNAHKKYGPYSAEEGACKFNKENNRAVVSSYEKLPAGEEPMLKAIQNGPIAVAFRVINDFYGYKEGVYSSDKCTGYANHAMVAVGYGTMSGKDYWIIRNSWGAGWGASGYALIERGVNMCRIETYAASVAAK